MAETDLFDSRYSFDYELDELGSGRFARVYRAWDTRQRKNVALKILKNDSLDDPRAASRVDQEVKVMQQFHQDNLVRVYEASHTASGDKYYVVMQLIEGSNLQTILDKCEPLGWDRTRYILGGIVKALAYLHRMGVVHGDVKPSNILVEEYTDKAYLVDFGLARAIGYKRYQSQTGEHMSGTVHYMAPELWKEQAPTPEADQYALAATLFEMLTGYKLVDGSLYEIMQGHCDLPVDLDRLLRIKSFSWLRSLLSRALEKSASNRYRSIEEFFRNVVQPEPVDGVAAYDWGLNGVPSFHTAIDGAWETLVKITEFRDLRAEGNCLWAAAEGGLIRWTNKGSLPDQLYTTADGLPHQAVTAVTTDRNGELWVGTAAGLCRGFHAPFVLVTALESMDVHDVLVSRFERSVWVATAKGLARLDERSGELLKWYGSPTPLPSHDVLCLYQEDNGVVWIGLKQGVAAFDGTRWKVYGPDDTSNFPNGPVSSIAGTPDGRLWIAARDGLACYSQGIWTPFNHQPENGIGRILQILGTWQGLWLTTKDRLAIYEQEELRVVSDEAGVHGIRTLAHFNDSGRDVVLATAHSVMEYVPQVGLRTYRLPEGPPDNDIRCIAAGRADTIWVGSGTGLSRRQRGAWQVFPKGAVRAMTYRVIDNTLWVVFENNELAIYQHEHWSPVGWSLASGNAVRGLWATREGTLWVGTDRGLWRALSSSTDPIPVEGFEHQVSSVLEGKKQIWVGTHLGIWIYKNDKWQPPVSRNIRLLGCKANCLYGATDSAVWAGTDVGAARHDGQVWTFLPALEGCKINSILQAPDRAMWFGTQAGLARFDGDSLQWLRKGQHLPDREVRAVIHSSGTLWIATGGGLVRFTPRKS